MDRAGLRAISLNVFPAANLLRFGRVLYFGCRTGPFSQSGMTLRDVLEDTGRFLIAVELETSRGLTMEEDAGRVQDMARSLAENRDADVAFITDNPGGNPHLRPEILGQDLLDSGMEVVINVACKDYNRNGLESRLWALGSAGLNNVLALSGDYPGQGLGGQAAPVFDTDSVGLLEMIRQMNDGLTHQAGPSSRRESKLMPTGFYPGAAVNPFKKVEGELMTQYFKLELKVRTGARYAVTQIGYDSRKLDETLRYTKMYGFEVPLFGSVFVLSAPAARFFNRWGIPGVAVSDELRDLAAEQARSKDRGRAFFDELAARQIAVLRGLGYRGAYISGRLRLSRLRRILEMERSYGRDDWKSFAAEVAFPQPAEYYYFERGENKGLSSDEVNPDYLESRSTMARLRGKLTQSPAFQLGRLVHSQVFENGSPGFKLGRGVYSVLEKSDAVSKLAHAAEQASKVPIYGCRDCGDCSLPDIAYLCPESQCVKNQRNGPCGGTKAGKCEVLDKDCIWLRAYDRLKPHGQERQMLERPIVFRDTALKGTSAWANTFLGRDHHGTQESDSHERPG